MGLVAEYEIGCEHLPFVDVAAAVPGATLEVALVATAAERTPFVVRVTDGPAEAVERAFESSRFVDEYTLLGRDADVHRYQVEPAVTMEEQLGDHVDDLAELRSLATNESDIEEIRPTPTGWIQRGWFADRDAFDEFRAFWQRNAPFTLRELTRDGRGQSPAAGLTDSQREALQVAYEMGYFEIPRTASLEDVAAELGIGPSAASERLRRAESHLVERTVNGRRPTDDPA